MPTRQERAKPLRVNEPALITAPPIPSTIITPAIIMFLDSSKLTLFSTMLLIHTEAIEPKSIIMIPPSTALGIL